ncbi:MAG: S41 family peptidase [Proteiniphilum sp.]|nr:S41 family peptidase [Proteiniphilum sp.]MEA4915993.1 S41 family peptidase [Proteiniphilum sp.]
MHEDIEFYYSTIKQVHPRLFARYSASEFDSLYNEIKNKCNRALSTAEFRYILDEFNGFTDGHTQVIMGWRFSDQIFPWVNCIDDKVFLKNDVLISIEGIDAMDLQRKISSTISWEENPQGRMHKFNFTLNGILADYYKLKAPFKCQLMDGEKGEVKDTLIHAISGEEWSLNNNPSRHPTYHKAILQPIIYEEESIAVLYYNTSDIREIPQKIFIKAIDDFFNEVNQKGITSLFIDVSQNGGGSDLIHHYILKHLKYEAYQSKTIRYSTKEGASKLYSFVETLLSHYDKDDKNQKDSYIRMKKALKNVKKMIKRGKVERAHKTKRKKDGFEGEVFVIMGPGTYSAGNDFCETIKLSKAGVLVGEPSGQYSPYSADCILGALPNSKFEYACATKYTESFPPVSPESGFLQPDIPYPLTKPLELEDFKEIIRISRHR